MQHIVVALALAASVQAFAPPRLVATTPAAKSVLPLSAPAKPLTTLRSAVAEETFEQRSSAVPTLQVDAGAARHDAAA